MDSPKLAYICFDVVPAAKGSSTHIAAFTKVLASQVKDLHLVTVSPTTDTFQSSDPKSRITQIALPALGKTLIDRVLYFRQQLRHWLQGRWFNSIQIRSIYEGFPIALNKHQFCQYLVFEVNGLPSIELKYRYPQVADDRELMQKLIVQEQICLEAADLIITPSSVTRDYLVGRRVAVEKIRVIPNGVDLSIFSYQAPRCDPELSPLRSLYFGTLSTWQGVAVAIDALGLYCRDQAGQLAILGSARSDQMAALQKQVDKLSLADSVQWHRPVCQPELVQRIHAADVILAPLTANDRNLAQGCCPLKVLEAMASGTPVITSDLPVITDLGENGTHFLAVKPGSAKALKDALLLLRGDRELRNRLSSHARQQIEQRYTWEKTGTDLIQAYSDLGMVASD